MSWSTAANNRILFLGAGILVIVLGFFTLANTQAVADIDQVQSRAFETLRAQDATRISLNSLYAALSAYVETGMQADLGFYGNARSQLLVDVANLVQKQDAIANSSSRIADLVPMVMINVAWSDAAVVLRGFGLEDAAERVSTDTQRRVLSARTTQIIDTLSQEIHLTLTDLAAQSAVNTRNAVIMTVFRTLTILMLLGVIYYFIRRDARIQRRFEQQLRNEQALLRTVIDVLPVNIYVKDRDLRFVLMNRSQARLIGSDSPESMIGRQDSDFFPPEWVSEYARDERAIFKTGKPLLGREEPSISPDGKQLVMLTTKMPVRDESGQVVQIVGVSQDITARKESERQIEQLHENVRQHAEWLELTNKELEAFSYTISHDLRAPLRAIDGFSRIVMNEYSSALPAEARRYLEKVRANTQRMGKLIDDLLQFARVSKQTLNLEMVEPAVLVKQVLDNELHTERQARPMQIVIGALPPCKADPTLLRQVYVNLLSNALKFSSKSENPRIEIGAQQETGNVVYYVRDNGVGFDEQYVGKLFGVFQRLHRQEDFDGTGAGLAIVQRVINRHGGHVWAEGGVDQGATFFFTLGDANE